MGLDDSPAPDSLLLDVTGVDHFFGGEAALAARVIHDFAHRGFTVCVAIADTIGTAWAAAHFDQAACGSAFSNRKGLSRKRLNGKRLVIIPPGEVSIALHRLPVEALRLADDVVELLHQLGIYQIGQFESLPRADLTSRFGPRLLTRLDQATGRLAEPIPALPLPPELYARWSLEHPTARRKTIEFILEQLIGRVARMLVRCGRGAVRLECRLDCQSARGVDLSVGLFRPTASSRHLFELARTQLEQVCVSGPVSAVHVRAAVTAPLESQQQEMFPDGPRARRPRQLARLVDRLSSRLGRRSVLRAGLLPEAQPELACRYDPLVKGLPAGRSRRGSSPRAAEAELPPRPLRLIGRPIPLAAVSIMPDGPPLRFHLRGREHRIVHTWGPERIETGWWRGRPVRRNYYRIETATGHRYWLFRRLDDGRWFLQGMFE